MFAIASPKKSHSKPAHHLPSEILRQPPFRVGPNGEDQFLKPIALQLPNPLHKFVRRPDQTGAPDQLFVDQLGLPTMQSGVMRLMRAKVAVFGWSLLHQL